MKQPVIRTHVALTFAGIRPLVAALVFAGSLSASAAVVNADFTAGTDVPVTASNYSAAGNTVSLALGYAPLAGTELMVVRNTGLGFINGAFDNLAHGQHVSLAHGGRTYEFVASYYGGTGNDLVLAWKNVRALSWGANNSSQLGENSTAARSVPVAVNETGALAGKTILALAEGQNHSLAVCSDGTLLAWGGNSWGQLGAGAVTDQSVPVVVNTASGVSALYGKTVIAVAAGAYHSLALCSDGTLAAWGNNTYGQLGDNSTTYRPFPTAVNRASGVSALNSKTVIGLAAGNYHSLAFCSDGTVAAWGENFYGQLGDNTVTRRLAPAGVNRASGVSALFGKTVIAMAGGHFHSLALCSDGTVAAWGDNSSGQLGDNTTIQRNVPAAVNRASGLSALYNRTVIGVASGFGHNLALCSDGTVAAWGSNSSGTLGDNSTTNRVVPVAVNTSAGSALFGKTVIGVAAGGFHSLVLCSDGTAASWGSNSSGALGDGTTTNRLLPVAVSTGAFSAGERFAKLYGSGQSAGHCMALAGAPTGQSALEEWRQRHFGSANNGGNAADGADPDGDGLLNLMEWACGFNPTSTSAWPGSGARNGPTIEYTYTRSVAALKAGAVFAVEWNDTLNDANWSSAGVTEQILSNNGTLQQVKADVPAGGNDRRFVRLRVTAPQ